MYSLYPKSRNDIWYKQRARIFTTQSSFDLSKAQCYCNSVDHPEAKMFLSMFPCRNMNELIKKLLRATDQGSIFAMIALGYYYNDNDSKRWYWLGRVANLEDPDYFTIRLSRSSLIFFDDISHSSFFTIGSIVKGKLKLIGNRSVFDMNLNSMHVFKFVERSVIYYEDQLVKCRKAVDAWTLVGIRLRVVKDIRKLIGMIIWESKNEELYF